MKFLLLTALVLSVALGEGHAPIRCHGLIISDKTFDCFGAGCSHQVKKKVGVQHANWNSPNINPDDGTTGTLRNNINQATGGMFPVSTSYKKISECVGGLPCLANHQGWYAFAVSNCMWQGDMEDTVVATFRSARIGFNQATEALYIMAFVDTVVTDALTHNLFAASDVGLASTAYDLTSGLSCSSWNDQYVWPTNLDMHPGAGLKFYVTSSQAGLVGLSVGKRRGVSLEDVEERRGDYDADRLGHFQEATCKLPKGKRSTETSLEGGCPKICNCRGGGVETPQGDGGTDAVKGPINDETGGTTPSGDKCKCVNAGIHSGGNCYVIDQSQQIQSLNF